MEAVRDLSMCISLGFILPYRFTSFLEVLEIFSWSSGGGLHKRLYLVFAPVLFDSELRTLDLGLESGLRDLRLQLGLDNSVLIISK